MTLVSIRLAKRAFVITACFVAIAACSGKDNAAKGGNGTDQNATEDSETTDAPLTADERICDEHFKAQLAWVGRCGGSLSDAPSALSRYRKLCARELAAPGAEALRDARSKCAARRAEAPCDEVIKECELPPGTLADGSACAVRAQCQSRFCNVDGSGCGTCAALVEPSGECTLPTDCAYGEDQVASCDYEEGKATGKCAVWKLVGIGATCGVDSFCKAGGHCESDTQDGPGKCVVNSEEGGACVDTTSCRPGLACIGKKCAQRPAEGESCSGYDDCGGGLACAETCQKPSLVNSGQECDALRHCSRGICVQKTEKGEDGQRIATEPPMCVAPITDGEPCGPNDQGFACDFFARCVGGKCVFSDPTQCK